MHALIVANAPAFDPQPFAAELRAAALLIAADGGGNPLWAAGITPHLVVGDLDSLDPAAEAAFRAAGAELLRHPAAKDETDLELALLLALARGATSIDVLGAWGGRWDQTLANVALLAMPELAGLAVRLRDEAQEAFLLRGPGRAELAGAVGETVSLLPAGGPAHGISSWGLHYPLAGASLRYERSRGVSNQIDSLPAGLELAEGMLLVLRQYAGQSQQQR